MKNRHTWLALIILSGILLNACNPQGPKSDVTDSKLDTPPPAATDEQTNLLEETETFTTQPTFTATILPSDTITPTAEVPQAGDTRISDIDQTEFMFGHANGAACAAHIFSDTDPDIADRYIRGRSPKLSRSYSLGGCVPGPEPARQNTQNVCARHHIGRCQL